MDHMGCSASLLLMLLFIAIGDTLKLSNTVSYSQCGYLLGVSAGELNPNLLLFHQNPGAKPCPSRGWSVIAQTRTIKGKSKINPVPAV